MARRAYEDALGVTGAETIIGTGVVVQGNVESQSDIIIDGTLKGDIKAGGNVVIGVNAYIAGDIVGVNISVAGELNGNITVEGEATIRETGQVTGDITATGLSIMSGGIFVGRSLMEVPPRISREAALPDKKTPSRRQI